MIDLGFTTDLGLAEMSGSSPSSTSQVHGSQNMDPSRADVIRQQKSTVADVGANRIPSRADATIPRADVIVSDDAGVPRDDVSGGGLSGRAFVSDAKADVSGGDGVVDDVGDLKAVDGANVGNNVNLDGANVDNNVNLGGRTSVWDRIDPTVAHEVKNKTFAAIVGSVPKPELDFFPVKEEVDVRV